jgi:tetratricopeptide (TPR) repeat protein
MYFSYKQNFVSLIILVLLTAVITSSCHRQEHSNNENTATVTSDSVSDELTLLNARVAQAPGTVAPYLERAGYFARNNMPNEALQDLNSALTINEKDPEIYSTLSDAYMYDGKMQRSLDAIKKARELSPDVGAYDVKMARIYLTMSDYKQTFNALRDGLRKDPNNAEAFFISGLANEEMGDTLKAIDNYQMAVAKKQDHYEALKQLGILFSLQRNRLAIDYLRNAASLRPDSPDPLYILAMHYQENGDPDKALGTYGEILLIDPSNKLAHYNKGYVFLVYKTDYLQAIESFSKAIELDSDYADAYYNRALSYELLGDKKAARTEYEKVLRLKVNDEKTISGLNRLDASEGK